MKFQEVFRQLNGRDATPDDVLRFERLTATLETTPGDALLSVLVALDHYETLYASIPEKIEEATNVAAKNAETQALVSFNSATAKLVADASKTIQRAIIVREWRNVFIALAVCIVVAVGMIVHTHRAGYTAGYAAGYSSGSADFSCAVRWRNMSEQVTKAYLSRFIADARTVTPDVSWENDAIRRVSSMIRAGDPARKQIKAWFENDIPFHINDNTPFNRASREWVSVEVQSVVRESPSTWHVDWIETTANPGGKVRKRAHMRAVLTVYSNPEQSDVFNPLGIYVRSFKW